MGSDRFTQGWLAAVATAGIVRLFSLPFEAYLFGAGVVAVYLALRPHTGEKHDE